MRQSDHGGGFSLNAAVRIEAADRKELESQGQGLALLGAARMQSLLRYCACPIYTGERLEWAKAGERLIYHLPKPRPDIRAAISIRPPSGWGSAGKPCAADSASWGCTSVAGWKPKKTTNRRTDSLPCLGRTRASDWGDPPWVDSWATASKAASERLPSPAIISSGMSCRSGQWRSRFHFLSKTRKNRVPVVFRSNSPDEDSAHTSLARRWHSPQAKRVNPDEAQAARNDDE
jgi:hypothetical protein